jgi:chlorite dismutase
MESYISSVLAYGLAPDWWELPCNQRKNVISNVSEILTAARNDKEGTLKAEAFESLRHDCNIIVWLLVKNPERVVELRTRLEKALGRCALRKYGFLSVYEPRHQESGEDRRYFVAYPLSKSPDWYLLDKGKRAGIMAEHINMAKTSANNSGINPYTTLSFGIDDCEFVVLYEVDSIPEWVAVTQDLRHANAHEWVTNEKPVLVGYKTDFGELLI